MVKLKMLGAAQEVGRSGFLVDAGDKILLDYGVKLNPLGVEYPLDPKTHLDAAIISHAHLDHSGHLPTLFNHGNIRTYMTPPTLELSRLLWNDTLKIAAADDAIAYFSKKEIALAEKYTFQVPYRKHVEISHNSSLELFDAGHILGSALVKLNLKNNFSMVYTGDYRMDDTRLQTGANVPFDSCDVLITESTYGNREHPPRKKEEKAFVDMVQETIDSGGHAVIAAFAVGRSQEVLDVLFEYGIKADVYLDGMCQAAAQIYLKNPTYLRDPQFLKKAIHSVKMVSSPRIRKEVLKKPSVVVTTAGMLQGGPVYQYLGKLYGDPNSSLIMTGYQVEGTPGRTALDHKRLVIDGTEVELKLKIRRFDFSAHAAHSELLKMIEKVSPKNIVLVHGDRKVMFEFRDELTAKGFKAFAPAVGDTLSF
ncbi:MAG: MBL fold metallo-hydrolase [Candidatus Diapherotrites archaeon]|nr:MBL fold metallo-hydrolase [Candidatus Diapherotrites archaeon]